MNIYLQFSLIRTWTIIIIMIIIIDWRPQLYTEYSSHSYTQVHIDPIVIISLPTREFTPGVLSSLEQTAWPRGGSPGALQTAWTAVWGSAVLPCFCRLSTELSFHCCLPIPNTCPFFFMLTDFLWRETDRLDWHLKASFRLSYGLLKPCCKIY